MRDAGETAVLDALRATCNHARFRPGQASGHYESFFVRANHPQRPLAFWIRYTVFSPRQRPQDAVGELWAVSFDGESGRHVAVKQAVPVGRCTFDPAEFFVRVGDAEMAPGRVRGAAASGGHAINWQLSYRDASEPLFLLLPQLYAARLPRAKGLVGAPGARFDGTLVADGTAVAVAGWVGSQNHNWGVAHTDHYAWGQVAGFDAHPESFLEVISARLKIGPLWTPFMTMLVLRHRGEEIALNGLRQAWRATASLRDFEWRFCSGDERHRVAGRISAPRQAFVGLRYANPPGGIKHCLNSKIARCEVTVGGPGAAPPEVLVSAHRAAFEIVADPWEHGVALQV